MAQNKFAECDGFQFQNCTVRVQPLAAVAALDAYQRIDGSQNRAIGTLVGYVSEGNMIDIVDIFQVTSMQKNGEVLFAQEYHKRMAKLRHQVHGKEQVLGWFSVGMDQEINEQTCSIQSFYKTKESMFVASPALPNPLYLMINLNFEEDSQRGLRIKVFTSSPTGHGSGPASADGAKPIHGYYDMMQFHEIPLHISSYQQEKQLLQVMLQAGQSRTAATAYDSFGAGVMRLKNLLKDAKKYVDLVLEGQVAEPDVEFGRELMKVLSLENNKTGELRDGGIRDAMMVQYLSTLARSEIVLSEKISKALSEATN